MFDLVNKAGGIKSMGGAKIEWIYADTESDDAKVAGELERLVLKEKVDAIIFPAPTGNVFAGATVYDRLKVPVISGIATCGPLLELDPALEYWRMVSIPSLEFPKGAARFLRYLVDNKGVTFNSIGIATADAAHLKLYRLGLLEELEVQGWEGKITLDIEYSHKAIDLVPTLLKVKQANPDVLFVLEASSTMPVWFKAQHDVGFEPQLMIDWITMVNYPQGVEIIGEDMYEELIYNKPIFAPRLLHPELQHEGFQGLRQGLDPWVEAHGWTLTDHYYLCAQCAYCFVAAWEGAGTKDPEAINNYLKTLEIPDGTPYFVYPVLSPAIKWHPNGAVVNVTSGVGQWLDSENELVWPPEIATGELKLQ